MSTKNKVNKRASQEPTSNIVTRSKSRRLASLTPKPSPPSSEETKSKKRSNSQAPRPIKAKKLPKELCINTPKLILTCEKSLEKSNEEAEKKIESPLKGILKNPIIQEPKDETLLEKFEPINNSWLTKISEIIAYFYLKLFVLVIGTGLVLFDIGNAAYRFYSKQPELEDQCDADSDLQSKLIKLLEELKNSPEDARDSLWYLRTVLYVLILLYCLAFIFTHHRSKEWIKTSLGCQESESKVLM